jgi:lycopene cyclase domain-containing protein
MTYFQFLGLFLGLPILFLSVFIFYQYNHKSTRSTGRIDRLFWIVLAVHVILAVLYTTPWDNYLVATGVWYYNPGLVIGFRLGWVPIEEYIFFVLQTILCGLMIWVISHRSVDAEVRLSPMRHRVRYFPVILAGTLWVGSLFVLTDDWLEVRYLSLILFWALPPVIAQFAIGGDILWKNRYMVIPTILLATAYLGFADRFAIDAGTWTIASGQSLNILIFGKLPIEELLFFLFTDMLVVHGITLSLDFQTWERFTALRGIFLRPFNSISK